MYVYGNLWFSKFLYHFHGNHRHDNERSTETDFIMILLMAFADELVKKHLKLRHGLVGVDLYLSDGGDGGRTGSAKI